MAGERSREHEAEKRAVIEHNSRKTANQSVQTARNAAKRTNERTADDMGGGKKKTRKMKAMWIILLVIIASGCFYAAYKIYQDKASEAIADEAPRIERTETPATPAVKATPTKPEPKEVKVEEIVEEPAKPQPQRSEYEDKFWSHINDPRWTGSKDPANMSVEEVCEYTNFVADHFGY